MTLAGRRVVIGVSGGIACYKVCTLARRLTQAGAAVDVVMTQSAGEFVGPVTFESLTGRPVLTSLWDRGRALDHVRLAQHPDLIVVAPATANLIAKAAQGIADDVLSTLLVAGTAPVLLAPAMNDHMWESEATQKNIAELRSRGWHQVGPAVGALAEGPSELPGRMAEPEEIQLMIERLLARGTLVGKRVVVTAGPTRERLDPVRVITNRSSGLMGVELARAAAAAGAEVSLILGPTQLNPSLDGSVTRVETTADLERAVRAGLTAADVLIMAAAPADFRPREIESAKLDRSGTVALELEATPDVLERTIGDRREGLVAIGFALESGNGLERARSKLKRKHLAAIVMNSADREDSGMESDSNQVSIIDDSQVIELPLLPKAEVAARIVDYVQTLL